MENKKEYCERLYDEYSEFLGKVGLIAYDKKQVKPELFKDRSNKNINGIITKSKELVELKETCKKYLNISDRDWQEIQKWASWNIIKYKQEKEDI